MILLCIIIALVIFALCLNARFKYKSYKKADKTLWQDGDSVRIMGPQGEAHKDGFMTRIS